MEELLGEGERHVEVLPVLLYELKMKVSQLRGTGEPSRALLTPLASRRVARTFRSRAVVLHICVHRSRIDDQVSQDLSVSARLLHHLSRSPIRLRLRRGSRLLRSRSFRRGGAGGRRGRLAVD